MLSMLHQLVALPSVSSALSGWDQSNRAVIELLAGWCEQIGMQAETIPVNTEQDKWNLVARVGPGKGGMVLAGHTDTVPYDSNAWKTDPFKMVESDNRLYGLGICDMKGFFPIALQVIESVKDHLRKPLILVATADEESSMAGARLLQKQGLLNADYTLIGEPTGLIPIHQHKGILMEEIKVEGRSGHSSQPALGRNALEAMTDVMLNLRQLRESWQEKYQNSAFAVPTPTLNLGCIHGGDNPNRICKQCQLQFDIRLLPGMDTDEVRQLISQRLQPVAQQHDVEISLQPLFLGVSSFQQAEDSHLVKLCESLTGRSSASVAFATEAPFFQALGSETIILGPGNIEQAHQPDEYLDADRITQMQEILTKLISNLCVDID